MRAWLVSIGPVRAAPWVTVAIVGAFGLVGCGGSSHKTASTVTVTAPAVTVPPSTGAIPPNAPPALRVLAGRVLRTGDLAGFAPQGIRAVGINAQSWVAEEG